MATANLTIAGMNSEAAMRGVRSALSVIRGVARVNVSLEEKLATVEYDPHKALPQQFQTAVRVMGCQVEDLAVEPPETVS